MHLDLRNNTETGTVICIFFGSPEPLGSQGELTVYPCSVVRRRGRHRRRCRRRRCRSDFSIIFSETAWPIKFKFHVEHL